MNNKAFKPLQNCNKITGYELTTALLRGGLAKLELKQSASIVLMYLASCYNGSVIYPHIITISENVGISETTTKRAIQELVTKGCILKSKRHKGNNSNEYLLTNKVLNLCTNKIDRQKEHKKNDTFKKSKADNQSIKMTLTCNKSNKIKLNNSISDEDLKLLKGYIESSPKITKKQSYLNKVLQSDCTLLLKRLKQEQAIKERAEKEHEKTQKYLQELKESKLNASVEIPASFRELGERLGIKRV